MNYIKDYVCLAGMIIAITITFGAMIGYMGGDDYINEPRESFAHYYDGNDGMRYAVK